MDKANTNNTAGQQIMAEGYTGADWVRTARRPTRTASQHVAEAQRYDDDSENDGIFTTATEAGAPVAATSQPVAAPVVTGPRIASVGETVTYIADSLNNNPRKGQTAEVTAYGRMTQRYDIRFADGHTKDVHRSEVQV